MSQRHLTRWQLSLRYLFVVTLLAAIVVLLTLRPLETRRRAVEALAARGGTITYGEPTAPTWVPDRLRNRVFFSVRSVALVGHKFSDEDLELLEPLSEVQRLTLNGSQISDVGLESLRSLTELTKLALVHTKVSNSGLSALSGLNSLREIDVRETRVTDAGLANLGPLLVDCRVRMDRDHVISELTSLRATVIRDTRIPGGPVVGIEAGSTRITDSVLARCAVFTELVYIDLADTEVSTKGFEHLTACAKLRSVNLALTQASDEDLHWILRLPNLRWLNLVDTPVSDAAIEKFKAARPEVKVVR